jgi:hypothetical protein
MLARFGLIVAGVSLCAGCGGDLSLGTENRVGRAWDRVIDTCIGTTAITPAKLQRARHALDEILDQYAKTPDASVHLIESDDPEPLRVTVHGLAHHRPPWAPECRELSRRAAGEKAPEPTPASFASGVIRRVPTVGTLAWSCDRQARQFFTRFTMARPGATVFIRLNTDGYRLYTHQRFNPAPPPARKTITAPLAARGQSWRIRYNHEPATILVKAHVRFARTGGRCVRWWTSVHRMPH